MKYTLITYLLVLMACTANNQHKPDGNKHKGKWPSLWNLDMEISIGESGGMVPEWWEIIIKGDSALYSYSYDNNDTRIKVLLSKSELDSIARVIKQNKPHKIKMKKHAVIYDKGSTYMRIRVKNKSISLSNGATESFTKKGWQKFGNIFATVNRIVMRNVNKHRINLTIRLDYKGSKNYWCHLQHNFRSMGIFGFPDTARVSVFETLPGRHSFNGYAFMSEDGKYKYGQKAWQMDYTAMRITRDTVLNFQLKDSVLQLVTKQ